MRPLRTIMTSRAFSTGASKKENQTLHYAACTICWKFMVLTSKSSLIRYQKDKNLAAYYLASINILIQCFLNGTLQKT
jgi:hypothetical protein